MCTASLLPPFITPGNGDVLSSSVLHHQQKVSANQDWPAPKPSQQNASGQTAREGTYLRNRGTHFFPITFNIIIPRRWAAKERASNNNTEVHRGGTESVPRRPRPMKAKSVDFDTVGRSVVPGPYYLVDLDVV